MAQHGRDSVTLFGVRTSNTFASSLRCQESTSDKSPVSHIKMGDILVIPTEMGAKTVERASESLCSTGEENIWATERIGATGLNITTGGSPLLNALDLQLSKAKVRMISAIDPHFEGF